MTWAQKKKTEPVCPDSNKESKTPLSPILMGVTTHVTTLIGYRLEREAIEDSMLPYRFDGNYVSDDYDSALSNDEDGNPVPHFMLQDPQSPLYSYLSFGYGVDPKEDWQVFEPWNKKGDKYLYVVIDFVHDSENGTNISHMATRMDVDEETPTLRRKKLFAALEKAGITPVKSEYGIHTIVEFSC
jgi:hypothetical protein